MKARGYGWIFNVSPVAGSRLRASKAAVIGFSRPGKELAKDREAK
jgi:hypothetical protein